MRNTDASLFLLFLLLGSLFLLFVERLLEGKKLNAHFFATLTFVSDFCSADAFKSRCLQMLSSQRCRQAQLELTKELPLALASVLAIIFMLKPFFLLRCFHDGVPTVAFLPPAQLWEIVVFLREHHFAFCVLTPNRCTTILLTDQDEARTQRLRADIASFLQCRGVPSADAHELRVGPESWRAPLCGVVGIAFACDLPTTLEGIPALVQLFQQALTDPRWRFNQMVEDLQTQRNGMQKLSRLFFHLVFFCFCLVGEGTSVHAFVCVCLLVY